MASKKLRTRKETLAEELKSHFDEFETVFVVGVDNVTSNQLHEIRKSMRSDAVIYCGKNTQMRRVIRELEEDRPELEKLRACCKLNVALVFTNGNPAEIRDKIQENKMDAPAKAGAINQVDVIIPKGMTTLEPTMTTFLQALNISSKITKGNIEILNDEHLLHKGEKCDASSAALLQKLGMMPFSYGLVTKFIYQNGAIFEPEVLDITDEAIIATFQAGIKNVACVSLMLNQPTVASVPYSILLAFSNLLAVAAATEFTFTEAEEIKKYLADPSAFACAAPAATTTAAPTAGAPAAADDDDDDEDAAPAASIFGGEDDDY
jgi:large subunit ribosomal protein LP0